MLKAPTKITLKNTTKMTLNARFTNIMKSRPPPTAQTAKPQVSTEQLASEKNRKLALQMENRHSVHASASATLPVAEPTRPSVRERLGAARGNIASRLRGGQASTFSRGRGGLRGVKRGGVQGAGGRGRYFQSPKRGGRGGAKQPARGGFKKRGGFKGKQGRGGGQRQNGSVDKNTLDNDLDSYMSKTKGSMDAELDAYMSSGNVN